MKKEEYVKIYTPKTGTAKTSDLKNESEDVKIYSKA